MDPVSTAASVLRLVNDLIDMAERVKRNKNDIGVLANRLKIVGAKVSELQALSRNLSETQVLALQALQNLISDNKGMMKFIEDSLSSGSIFTYVAKMAGSSNVADRIESYNTALDRIIGDLNFVMGATGRVSASDSEETYVKVPCPNPLDPTEPSLLGEGGYGEVHLMRNRNDNTFVAVKSVKLRKMRQANISIEEVQEEIGTLCKLTHKNVIRYFCSYFSANNTVYNIVMEYASGGTMASQITSKIIHSETTISGWMKQALSALAYMHEEGIIHRDIKPENMLLDSKSNIKLADVGLACVITSSSFAQSKVGTALYMSYEKAHDGYYYDGRDDVWATGCVLVELLTKRRLNEWGGALYEFHSANVVDRKQRIIAECRLKSTKLTSLAEEMLSQYAVRPQAAACVELLYGGSRPVSTSSIASTSSVGSVKSPLIVSSPLKNIPAVATPPPPAAPAVDNFALAMAKVQQARQKELSKASSTPATTATTSSSTSSSNNSSSTRNSVKSQKTATAKPAPQPVAAVVSTAAPDKNPARPGTVVKRCGHACSPSSLLKCCACMDKRPMRPEGTYPMYKDGVGWMDKATRSAGYCPVCV